MDEINNEYIGSDEVCRMIGGIDRPVHISTLNRWIRQGKMPKPKKMSARINRWRKADVIAAIRKILEAEPEAEPAPEQPST